MTGFDTVTGVPAAWYPDPQGPPLLRWWDGSAWTQSTRDPREQALPAVVVPEAPAAPAVPATPVVPEPTTGYVPMGAFESQPSRTDTAYWAATPSESTQTWAIWAFALYPLVQLVVVLVLSAIIESFGGTASRLAVGGSGIFLSLYLGRADSKLLKERGYRPPGWGWTLLPLVYFIIRTVRVGRGSLGPLFAWVGLQAALAAVVIVSVLLPLLLMLNGGAELSPTDRAAQLTPTGMAEKVTADMLANGFEVTSVVCPPLASTVEGSAVTCEAQTATSNLYVVVEVTPSDPDYAFAITSGYEYQK